MWQRMWWYNRCSYLHGTIDCSENRGNVAECFSQMDSQQRKINEFYPWSAESNLTNQFILCLDNNAFSGEFILHETIIKLLRDSQNVYLISTNHSRNHYEAIFKKNVRFCSLFMHILSGTSWWHQKLSITRKHSFRYSTDFGLVASLPVDSSRPLIWNSWSRRVGSVFTFYLSAMIKWV